MSEYIPLAKLIEQGLQEGTVLECLGPTGGGFQSTWNGTTFLDIEWNPFNHDWRIVSTPPKKITFETVFRGLTLAMPDEHGFNIGDAVIVTVEEKR